MKRLLLAVATLVAFASGCAFPGTGATPSPTAGPTLTTAELRYRLIDAFGPPWFCDPDEFPVARFDEQARAIERFGEMQSDREAFDAILAHLAIQPGTDVSDEQKLAIYRAWKALNAIVVDPADGDTYRFDYLNQPAPNESVGRRTTGTIDAQGTITIEQQDPAGQPPCPICLARGTAIATPDGDLAVEDVRVGMRVWSFDATGRRVDRHGHPHGSDAGARLARSRQARPRRWPGAAGVPGSPAVGWSITGLDPDGRHGRRRRRGQRDARAV